MNFQRMIVRYRHMGEDLVSVTLDNEGKYTATFDQADWDFLTLCLGLSPTLSIGPFGYVRSPAYKAPGCNVNVARVLLDAGKGDVVHYKDGDRFNLRRKNLTLRPGMAKNRDRLFLTPKARAA